MHKADGRRLGQQTVACSIFACLPNQVVLLFLLMCCSCGRLTVQQLVARHPHLAWHPGPLTTAWQQVRCLGDDVVAGRCLGCLMCISSHICSRKRGASPALEVPALLLHA